MIDMHIMVNKIHGLDDEFSQAEAVLPLQFHGARRGASAIEPLLRLMVAMLVDAIRCFQTKLDAPQPAKRQELAEVRSWIFSDDDNGFFSFRAVCDELEIDPKAIRKRLVQWEKGKLAGEKPRLMIRRLTPVAKRISTPWAEASAHGTYEFRQDR
jgi:hypothetical protein